MKGSPLRFDDVRSALGRTPHMTPAQGQAIYNFICDKRPKRILELGFAHGTSTCYLAAALDEIGGDGHIVTIDRAVAMERKPNIRELLDRVGLTRLVTPIITDTRSSYTWELMRMLAENSVPSFDFVFIDGAHLWDVDGFAFLLADRLLAPGGWVLFDDLDWTLAASRTLCDKEWVQALPAVERTTPQVRKIFELLVRTHPDYTDFLDRDGWGWARKREHRFPPMRHRLGRRRTR
jgi:predicted O-methyltransferase YrrM